MPEAPGILAWLVAGCRRWQIEGLGELPEAVKDATAEYRRDCDQLGEFFEDRCVIAPDDPSKFETAQALYDAYLQHCQQNNEKTIISKTEFGLRLRGKGLVKDKNQGARIWRGIALRP
jgi:putative DNA primase/helicase